MKHDIWYCDECGSAYCVNCSDAHNPTNFCCKDCEDAYNTRNEEELNKDDRKD